MVYVNPYDRFLHKVNVEVDRLREEDDRIISCKKIPRPYGMPAREFFLSLNAVSIERILEDKSPVFRLSHEVRILFGPDLYGPSALRVSIESPIWHPNIQNRGAKKGEVCMPLIPIDRRFSIGNVLKHLYDILEYRVFFIENKYPYPFALEVAKWVRSYAFPRGIVSNEGVNMNYE